MNRPYNGAKATGYDTKRLKQAKWHAENMIVSEMMKGANGSVLDVPVGTGRFIELYKSLRLSFVGIDLSEDMLAEARVKLGRSKNGELYVGDASKLEYKDRDFKTVVCVRLLHLLKEKEMRAALREVCRVASERVILTIQLRDEYSETPDVQTHDEKKFNSLVRQLGWGVADDRKITGAGWHVMRLARP